MKKIFIAAAACLALFSCSKPQMDTPKPDAIEVTPGSATFGEMGGSADVIVTSNGDWTLTADAEYSWVRASVAEGKDGDVVTFTVEPNVEADRTADFTFKSGIASATFKVFSYAGEAPVLTLTSESKLSLGYEAGQVEILLSSNKNHYREVECTLSEGAAEWLTYRATLPGETEADAKVYFDYAALEDLADREATITVSVPGLTPATVELTQFAKHVLSTPSPRYTVGVDGETIIVPLSANVEYKIDMEGADGWLTVGEATAEGVPFTATALEGMKRAATVTFTQTDAEADETPLSCQIDITQVAILVKWAADMQYNRLFPKWENGGIGAAKNFTLESLIYIKELPTNQMIATIMGIEGVFLARLGDAGVALNQLQIATSAGNYVVPGTFETLRWYHLAITFDNAKVKIYVDGELKGEKEFVENRYVWGSGYVNTPINPNITPSWSYETSGYGRCFWFGYSYDGNRSFPGYITEIRMWNKTLSAEEINADNHFFTVDPASEGLYSYWKFVEGEGSTIADATGNGNPLYGETDIAKDVATDANKGPEGIEWVSVALPDR